MNNITNIVLNNYQINSIKKIDEKLLNGAKHISVTMDPGMGLTTMAAFYLKKMVDESCGRVAVVYCKKESLIQGIEQAKAFGIDDKVDFYSVKSFVEQDKEYDYLLLHDLRVTERKIISDYISDKELTTISFFTAGQELRSSNSVESDMLKRINPYLEKFISNFSVFSTRDVLDIRDAKKAGTNEIENIKNDNSYEIEQAYIIKEKTIEALDEQEAKLKRLIAYANAYKEKTKTDEIEELKKQVETLKKDKEELSETVDSMNHRMHYLNDILTAVGVDANEAHKYYDEIESYRKQLKERLESDSIEEREIAFKLLQDKTAASIHNFVQANIKKVQYDNYEKALRERLSDEVWNKLDSNSQTFLVSAKSSFDSMKEMEQNKELDYSGVCLLVTKALEIETTKRFFQNYVSFLQRKYNSISRWPYVLRQRDHGQITDNVIQEHEFTLGSVVSVVGMKRDYDEDNNIIGYSVSHVGTKNEFLDYALHDLYKSSNRAEVEAELERDYRFIEKVRIDYRNPSAHRGRLKRTSAQSCLEYVIDVQHMLRDMLDGMKI